MKAAIEQFASNIGNVRELGGLAKVLATTLTPSIDLGDILRMEIVLAVSAFDHFIHELVRFGMLESYQRLRPETDAFRRFRVSLEGLQRAINSPASTDWLSDQIREAHSWQSFQMPDKLADGIRLISSATIWEEIGERLSLPAKDAKERLRLIVERRNKIAHEADVDPTFPDSRWPISAELADQAVDYVERVGDAVYDVVARESEVEGLKFLEW